MDIRWMRAFLAVAEESNFGRAAVRLHLAQPAVTAQIRNLEKSLGVRLFDRDNRGARLTDAGTAFLQPCHDALRLVEAAGRQAQNAGTGEHGKIRIGFNAACGIDQLIPLARAIRSGYPHLELRIDVPRRNAEILRLVEIGDLDIGLAGGPATGESLAHRVVSTARLCVLVPHGHRLAALATVATEQLVGEPFLLVPPGPGRGIRSMVEDACERAGFRPSEVIEVPEVTTALAMVVAGVGFGFTTTTSTVLTPAGVTMIPLVDSMEIPTVLVWKAGPQSKTMQNVLRLAHSVFE